MGQHFSTMKQKHSTVIRRFPKYSNEKLIVIARYKYEAMGSLDLSFQPDDVMQVVNQFNEFWYEVIKMNDKKQGLVPSNYVSKQDGSPQSVEGWWDIERWEAEKILMNPDVIQGTYLVRPSKKKRDYIISVKKQDNHTKTNNVKHFMIKVIKEGNKIMYSAGLPRFSDFEMIIKHYTKYGIGTKNLPLNSPFVNFKAPPIHSVDMNIKQENIHIISEIGKGTFGPVNRAIWGQSYIVTAKSFSIDSSKRKKFVEDVSVFNKLRHRYIVEILGICTEPKDSPIVLMCEYLRNGSLKKFLQSAGGAKFNLLDMVEKFAEISEGMAYLESKNVAHCNLRSENILLDYDFKIKVSDFGVKNLINEQITDEEFNMWLAPESVTNRIFNSKSDVWSYGIVMFEILTWCKTPYPGISANEVIDKVTAGYRMDNPQCYFPGVCCPCEIYNLMLRCWDINSEARPKFSHIKNEIDTWIVKKTFESYYNNFNVSEYCNS